MPLIVCFGDSLTAGYQSPSAEDPQLRETPYGAFLQERLGSAVEVITRGICGEVTSAMVERFPRDVLAHRPAYVVILGGTNDLGWNRQASAILQNLRSMYEQARRAGSEPVAVTVPSIRPDGGSESAVEWLAEHIARRQTLNRQIMDYCGASGIRCVDLFSATAEPQTNRLADIYSNDGLHLTTAGYRRLADLLYDQIFGRAFEQVRHRVERDR